jgi:hypothetical protein
MLNSHTCEASTNAMSLRHGLSQAAEMPSDSSSLASDSGNSGLD